MQRSHGAIALALLAAALGAPRAAVADDDCARLDAAGQAKVERIHRANERRLLGALARRHLRPIELPSTYGALGTDERPANGSPFGSPLVDKSGRRLAYQLACGAPPPRFVVDGAHHVFELATEERPIGVVDIHVCSNCFEMAGRCGANIIRPIVVTLPEGTTFRGTVTVRHDAERARVIPRHPCSPPPSAAPRPIGN